VAATREPPPTRQRSVAAHHSAEPDRPITISPEPFHNIGNKPQERHSVTTPPADREKSLVASRATVISTQSAVLPAGTPSSPDVPISVEPEKPNSVEPEKIIAVSKSPVVDLPPELSHLHPRIQEVLASNPKLIKLLQKHPEVMTNFHAGTISRLGTLLKKAQESEQLQLDLDSDNVRSVSDSEAAACRTVIVSRLPADATTSDVEALFDDLGLVEVELPKESRRKRHLGIAIVMLMDAKTAVEAVRRINGADFVAATDPHGTVTQIAAQLAIATSEPGASVERVQWKASDELWQQHMFNPNASVIEGCQNHVAVEVRPASDAARAEFRDAARKEREEQAKLATLIGGDALAL